MYIHGWLWVLTVGDTNVSGCYSWQLRTVLEALFHKGRG